MKKRLLALALALVMICGLLPAFSAADGEPPEGIEVGGKFYKPCPLSSEKTGFDLELYIGIVGMSATLKCYIGMREGDSWNNSAENNAAFDAAMEQYNIAIQPTGMTGAVTISPIAKDDGGYYINITATGAYRGSLLVRFSDKSGGEETAIGAFYLVTGFAQELDYDPVTETLTPKTSPVTSWDHSFYYYDMDEGEYLLSAELDLPDGLSGYVYSLDPDLGLREFLANANGNKVTQGVARSRLMFAALSAPQGSEEQTYGFSISVKKAVQRLWMQIEYYDGSTGVENKSPFMDEISLFAGGGLNCRVGFYLGSDMNYVCDHGTLLEIKSVAVADGTIARASYNSEDRVLTVEILAVGSTGLVVTTTDDTEYRMPLTVECMPYGLFTTPKVDLDHMIQNRYDYVPSKNTVYFLIPEQIAVGYERFDTDSAGVTIDENYTVVDGYRCYAVTMSDPGATEKMVTISGYMTGSDREIRLVNMVFGYGISRWNEFVTLNVDGKRYDVGLARLDFDGSIYAYAMDVRISASGFGNGRKNDGTLHPDVERKSEYAPLTVEIAEPIFYEEYRIPEYKPYTGSDISVKINRVWLENIDEREEDASYPFSLEQSMCTVDLPVMEKVMQPGEKYFNVYEAIYDSAFIIIHADISITRPNENGAGTVTTDHDVYSRYYLHVSRYQEFDFTNNTGGDPYKELNDALVEISQVEETTTEEYNANIYLRPMEYDGSRIVVPDALQ